jgi:DNA-binding NarL/FixJ family response regulator
LLQEHRSGPLVFKFFYMSNMKGLKILLIDDTQIVLEHLQTLLSELTQVSSTEAVLSAEEALSMLDNYEPDIMVLDINMPGMNGIEMLRKLSLKNMIRPVVIMLTNNTFAKYKDECMRLGADYFLDKSRDFQMIPSIVELVQQHKFVRL